MICLRPTSSIYQPGTCRWDGHGRAPDIGHTAAAVHSDDLRTDLMTLAVIDQCRSESKCCAVLTAWSWRMPWNWSPIEKSGLFLMADLKTPLGMAWGIAESVRTCSSISTMCPTQLNRWELDGDIWWSSWYILMMLMESKCESILITSNYKKWCWWIHQNSKIFQKWLHSVAAGNPSPAQVVALSMERVRRRICDRHQWLQPDTMR